MRELIACSETRGLVFVFVYPKNSKFEKGKMYIYICGIVSGFKRCWNRSRILLKHSLYCSESFFENDFKKHSSLNKLCRKFA